MKTMGGKGASRGMGAYASQSAPPPPPPDSPPPPSKTPGFQAGPMVGGKVIQPQGKMGEATVKVPSTSKCLIFVVDLQNARSLDDEPKKVHEMKEDIADAIGVTADAQQLQVVLAGYSGPVGQGRATIDTDEELNDFFSKFIDVGMKKPAESDASKNNTGKRGSTRRSHMMAQNETEMSGTQAELKKMRLGGIITKMQMVKYVKLLQEEKIKTTDLTLEKHALEDQLKQTIDSIPARIEAAVNQAKLDLTVQLNLKHQAELQEQMQNMKREAEAKMRPLQAQILKQQMQNEALQDKMTEITKQRDEGLSQIETLKKEKEKVAEKLRKEQEKAEKEAENLRATIASNANSQLSAAIIQQQLNEMTLNYDEACETLRKHGLPLPGEEVEEVEEVEEEVPMSFSFKIPHIEEKMKTFIPGRAYQSSEFELGVNKDRFQLEFYPNGVEMSSSGSCALRLRPPNNTLTEWRIKLEKKDLGSRRDEFSEDNWWSRHGVLWSNFCGAELIKSNINDEDGSLEIHMDLIKSERIRAAAETPVGQRLPRLPQRLTPVASPLPPFDQVEPVAIGNVEIRHKGELIFEPALLTYVSEYLSRPKKSRGGTRSRQREAMSPTNVSYETKFDMMLTPVGKMKSSDNSRLPKGFGQSGMLKGFGQSRSMNSLPVTGRQIGNTRLMNTTM